MIKQRVNIISDEIIRNKLTKINKEIVTEANRAVRGGGLDCEGLGMYLAVIDQKLQPVKNEINNALDEQIATLRQAYFREYSEAERNLETFDNYLRRLNSAAMNVEKKAKEIGMPVDNGEAKRVSYKGLGVKLEELRRTK